MTSSDYSRLLLEFTAASIALAEHKKPSITRFAPRSLNKRARRVAEKRVVLADLIARTGIAAEKRIVLPVGRRRAGARTEKRIAEAGIDRLPRRKPDKGVGISVHAQNAEVVDIKLRAGIDDVARKHPADRSVAGNVEIRDLRRIRVLDVIAAAGGQCADLRAGHAIDASC